MDSHLPGAAFDFRDVTTLFQQAAADMYDDQMLFMDGFSLQDAMAAFEIGEPRLDSGYIPPADASKPKFDPLALLLPEELCWIIDRAFAYEMEWHNGNFMSHTVLTFLYIHHLYSMDPDLAPPEFYDSTDQDRPPELVIVVLRAAVAGLLKCCDLTWRELSKGAVQDTEDWQSDKCEVYLWEGTPVRVITSMLEEACIWVSDSPKVPYQWKDPLISRLQLRKTFLQLLDTNTHRSPAQFNSYITICQELITKIRPLPDPHAASPVHRAFDPYVSRRLNTVVPIRVLPVGSARDTWKAWYGFFEALKETVRLAGVHSISTWKAVGTLRVWTAKSPIQQPYIRSLTQSAFYDNLLIFDNYSFTWLVEKFFSETIGVSWSYIQSQLRRRWIGSGGRAGPPIEMVERDIYKLIIPHIRGNWSNPPRRRRQLMKSLVGWHRTYESLTQIVADVDLSDFPQPNVLQAIPSTVLLWRLSAIREIVLSGFQLELYAPEERTFAYWYLVQVLEAELVCWEGLGGIVPPDSPAFKEMVYTQQLGTALQALCSALFIMTIPLLSLNWNRTRPNFFRRYKWAFKPEYDYSYSHNRQHHNDRDYAQDYDDDDDDKYDEYDEEVSQSGMGRGGKGQPRGDRDGGRPVANPNMTAFVKDCVEILKDESGNVARTARESVEFGVALLHDLAGLEIRNGTQRQASGQGPKLGTWADVWVDDRQEFIEVLAHIAGGLLTAFLGEPEPYVSSSSSKHPNGTSGHLDVDVDADADVDVDLDSEPPPPSVVSSPASASTSVSTTAFGSLSASLSSGLTVKSTNATGIDGRKEPRRTSRFGLIGELRWDPNRHPWIPTVKFDSEMEMD